MDAKGEGAGEGRGGGAGAGARQRGEGVGGAEAAVPEVGGRVFRGGEEDVYCVRVRWRGADGRGAGGVVLGCVG